MAKVVCNSKARNRALYFVGGRIQLSPRYVLLNGGKSFASLREARRFTEMFPTEAEVVILAGVTKSLGGDSPTGRAKAN